MDYYNAILVGIPDCQRKRLQSVINASARLVSGARRNDHITPVLCDLHWLQVSERINYKVAVLTFKCLSGTAPTYLSSTIQKVADIPSRKRLRSSSGLRLIIPRSRLVSVGDRAFPVAAARIWNSLPLDVISADSLAVFRKRLKTHLFSVSYS